MVLFPSPQRAHNHHEAQFSVAVPENGHLSGTTYQFLRQAYITIYASMVRYVVEQGITPQCILDVYGNVVCGCSHNLHQ